MTKKSDPWMVEGRELDISRGIEAAFLGLLMMVVRLLRTSWAFFARWKSFEECILSNNSGYSEPRKFERPLTFACTLWMLYLITFSSRFSRATEMFPEMRDTYERVFGHGVGSWIEIYGQFYITLANRVLALASSGNVWNLALASLPVLATIGILSASIIVSCRLLRAAFKPQEQFAITCYFMGMLAVGDYAFGYFGYLATLIHPKAYLFSHLVFFVFVWPRIFLYWIKLTKLSAQLRGWSFVFLFMLNLALIMIFSFVILISYLCIEDFR